MRFNASLPLPAPITISARTPRPTFGLNSRPVSRAVGIRFLALCLLATISLPGISFAANPIEQVRSSSALKELDLEKLKSGEIASVRPPLGSFPRGVYVEDCFFVRAPIAAVGEKLLHWDTSKHPQLEVTLLREYSWPANPGVFDALRLSSSRARDKWLLDRTVQSLATGQADGIFVAPNEITPAQIPADQREAKVNDFWKKILGSRDRAVASGGLDSLPRFQAGKIDISIRNEFDSLMKMAPNIASHFQPLISTKPFAESGSAPNEIVPYWQESIVQGHTSLHSGFLAALKRSTSWQVADCSYLVSDTYYMSVTLYELWPVENGTVVWQIDFISAPFRSFLGGTDRFFAGKEMIKGAAKSIPLFRADVEK
jgi:hypothetical protein